MKSGLLVILLIGFSVIAYSYANASNSKDSLDRLPPVQAEGLKRATLAAG